MTQKNQLQECPKCRSLKTVKDAYGFKCESCGTYFPQSRVGNEKKKKLKVKER